MTWPSFLALFLAWGQPVCPAPCRLGLPSIPGQVRASTGRGGPRARGSVGTGSAWELLVAELQRGQQGQVLHEDMQTDGATLCPKQVARRCCGFTGLLRLFM